MFGGRAPRNTEPVDNETYYNLLGVTKESSKSEVHKAYLKLARTKHPDKGGSPEEFQAITQAHDVLYDDEKR